MMKPDELMACVAAKQVVSLISRRIQDGMGRWRWEQVFGVTDDALEEEIKGVILDLATDGTKAEIPSPIALTQSVTFGGVPPCSRADCPTSKAATPGSLHWHMADLPPWPPGERMAVEFKLDGKEMGAILATPPETPILSCRRHRDCLRAPKGQLCCRDPECKQMDCQVPR